MYRMKRFEFGIMYGIHGDEVVLAAVAHPSDRRSIGLTAFKTSAGGFSRRLSPS
jgi:hypothetical protein